MIYERIRPYRDLMHYVASPGEEVGGRALTPAAYDALSEARTSHKPCAMVVIGIFEHEDGKRYLDFGTPTAYIEAITDYRWDENAHRLRFVCQSCGLRDGKHMKSCELA